MQELWFLYSVCCLKLIDIYMNFCEDSFNRFKVIEQTQVWQNPREITQKYKCKSYGSYALHVI